MIGSPNYVSNVNMLPIAVPKVLEELQSLVLFLVNVPDNRSELAEVVNLVVQHKGSVYDFVWAVAGFWGLLEGPTVMGSGH